MGYILKRRKIQLLIFLLMTINLSAQIAFDTIPDNEIELGGHHWEEIFIFKNFENQLLRYFDKIDFENLDCYGEKVFVSTIFSKNGETENTRIVQSASPICDSIAYTFVAGLKNWLPGLQRGRFVDIAFIFPIAFDTLETKKRSSRMNLFGNASEEEYNRRKEYFDFVHSELYEQEIINDFEFFKKYVADVFRDSLYIHILTEYKQKRKESIELQFNPQKSKNTHVLIRDYSKERVLYEYNLKKNKKIRVPRDKDLFLLFYSEGTNPLIQTATLNSVTDSIINLSLENYTKGRLLDEINTFSP